MEKCKFDYTKNIQLAIRGKIFSLRRRKRNIKLIDKFVENSVSRNKREKASGEGG